MEKAEETVNSFLPEMCHAVSTIWRAFSFGPEDANRALRKASDSLEDIQAKLDDAQHILGRVLDE